MKFFDYGNIVTRSQSVFSSSSECVDGKRPRKSAAAALGNDVETTAAAASLKGDQCSSGADIDDDRKVSTIKSTYWFHVGTKQNLNQYANWTINQHILLSEYWDGTGQKPEPKTELNRSIKRFGLKVVA